MNGQEKQRMHILTDADAIDNPPLSAVEKHELDQLQTQYILEQEKRYRNTGDPLG